MHVSNIYNNKLLYDRGMTIIFTIEKTNYIVHKFSSLLPKNNVFPKEL